MIDKAIALHRAVPPDKLMAHGLKLPVTSSFYTFPYIWMHQPLRVDRILRRVSASTERYEGKTNSKGQLHGWGRYAHSLEADSVDLSMPICVLLRSHPLRSPGMLFASHHIASHHLPLFSLATEFKPQQNLKNSVTALVKIWTCLVFQHMNEQTRIGKVGLRTRFPNSHCLTSLARYLHEKREQGPMFD